jgi:hypothetical protein
VFRQIQDCFHAIFHCHWRRVYGCETIVDAHEDNIELGDDCISPACVVAGITNSETATVEVDNDRIFLIRATLES